MLQITTTGHVRRVTLDRPEARNAFNQALYRALGSALADAATDDEVRVVVIDGGASFSAGQDLKEMAKLVAGEGGGGDGFNVMLEALETFPKPLLAAVEGAAVGIGMTMLAHVDIVIVARTARLRVPFSEMGVPPEAGSSVLFPQRLGWQAAAELLFTARWISGEEATTLGLARRAVDDGQAVDAAMELAVTIAGFDPWATQRAKRLMLEGRSSVARDARIRESAAFAELFAARRGPE